MKRIFLLATLIGSLFISCSDDDNILPNETSCDSIVEVVSDENFNGITTTNYIVSDVQLNGNCLEVTIGASGCDPNDWEMNFVASEIVVETLPIQWNTKIELITNQDCLAYFDKTVSFDLTPFQLSGQNVVSLNIEGWDEQIIYEY